MSTSPHTTTTNDHHTHEPRRVSTETKAAFKTTEFIVFIAAVVGVLAASQMVGSDSPGGDIFRADNAWMLITALAIGYMISRGLAKSGSRDFHND